jgi:hypothetical protein
MQSHEKEREAVRGLLVNYPASPNAFSILQAQTVHARRRELLLLILVWNLILAISVIKNKS